MGSAFSRTGCVVLILTALSLLCLLGFTMPLELLFFLLAGWVLYLVRVIPQLQPDWSSAALFGAALVMLAAGLHWLLAWLTARQPPPTGSWRLRWTLAAVAITLLLFVSGISMIGVTHQIAWLATARQPLVEGFSYGAARRMQSGNHLKQIALALQNYHDVTDSLPPGMVAAKSGQALHGWQTLVLPFMEQKVLFDGIDFSKAWDDPAQRELFSKRIPPYLIPADGLPQQDDRGYALSHYAGNVHVLGGARGLPMAAITDGTSQTIFCGEAGGNYKPWAHPRNWRDPARGLNRAPDGFGSPWKNGGATFAFADGHTQFLSSKIDPAVLRALATPAAGDQPGSDY